MKRILLISYAFPPNASAGAVRSERFARYLPKFGWGVDVITICRRRDMYQDENRLHTLGPNVSVSFTRSPDPWLWLRDKKPNNIMMRATRSALMQLFSFPDHMLLWIPFAVKSGLDILKKKRNRAIYSTSPPHSSHLAGLFLSRMTGIPWIADFRDPWSLNTYHDGYRVKKVSREMERFLETKVYQSASAILANTNSNRLNVLKAFPFQDEKKVIHVPNTWENFPIECIPKERKNNPLTIVHAGTFYPRFKPYSLLYALASWRDGKKPREVPPLEKKDVKVILLGAKDEKTAEVVRDLRLTDLVEARPWVSLNAARKIMCEADFLWASLGTGIQSRTFLPSKLFEYIAAEKPILGFFADGEASNLIREGQVGTVFTEENHDAVIRKIYEGMCAKKQGESIEYHANQELIKSYHIERVAEKLADVLNHLA